MTYWKAICEDDALCDIYASYKVSHMIDGLSWSKQCYRKRISCETANNRTLRNPSIIQQAKGLNKEATRCNMQVLHSMERHIQTAAGVTERSLKFDKTNRNYGGIGQGSGNGPQHGNDTNGLNKDILARETQSYEFSYPNESEIMSWHRNVFIEEIIHFVLLSSNCFIAAVPTVTRKLQLWQNFLNASGGDLAINKCVIVFLLYKTILDKGKSKQSGPYAKGGWARWHKSSTIWSRSN